MSRCFSNLFFTPCLFTETTKCLKFPLVDCCTSVYPCKMCNMDLKYYCSDWFCICFPRKRKINVDFGQMYLCSFESRTLLKHQSSVNKLMFHWCIWFILIISCIGTCRAGLHILHLQQQNIYVLLFLHYFYQHQKISLGYFELLDLCYKMWLVTKKRQKAPILFWQYARVTIPSTGMYTDVCQSA